MAATQKKKKGSAKKRRKLKIIVFIIEIIILLVVLAALFVSIKLSKLDSGNKIWEDEDRQVNDLSDQTKEHLDKYTTIAVFGLDNRTAGRLSRGNSDVIMLFSINEDTKEIKVASVYRDTYLDVTDGDGYNKANAAYAYGGPAQAINMLNINLDLNIEDYVAIDFKSVATVVDLLGGIEMTITDAEAHWMIGHINETAQIIGKPAKQLPGGGTYTLDGVQAVAYARVRQTAGSDFKRTERQREVVQKMVEKAQKSDLVTINKIIDQVFPLVETSLTQADILMLAKDAFSYSMGETCGFPFDKTGMHVGKITYAQVPADLKSNVEQLHAFLYENEEYEMSAMVQLISDEIVERSGVTAKKTEE